MADHIAPGAETSRQQVQEAITAAIEAAVEAEIAEGLNDEIASAVQSAVSAAITTQVIAASVAAYVAANPLANLQQTSGMDADDEVNSATIYAGGYPAKYPSENLWPYELKVKARADANGNLIPLLFKQQLAEIPETQGPVTPLEGAGLDTSWSAFKAEYVVPADPDGAAKPTAGSIPSDGNVSLSSVVKALQQATLQGDVTTYDLILGWAKTNLRRTSRSNFKDLFASTWDTAGSGSVSDWTASFGLNQQLWLAVWQQAQDSNRTSDVTLASEIARGLVTMVSPEDESRLYPIANDLSATTSVNGGLCHHVTDSKVHLKVELGRINPAIFRLMKTFTGDARFDKLREGYYHLTDKQLRNDGDVPTSKGLPARYLGVNVTEHGSIYAITNGNRGWSEDASTDFDDVAADQLTWLRSDYDSFKDSRALVALQATKQFFVDAWNAGHIYTLANRSGVFQNSVETASMYYSAIFALSAGDPSNATANAIRLAKLPTDLASKVIGGTTYYYLPNQPKDSTYVSSRTGNQAAWLNRALDINKFADLYVYGPQANTGTTSPSTGGGGTTPTNPTGPVVVPETPTNLPVGAADLFVSPQSTLYQWWQQLPAGSVKKQRIGYSALKALAKWVGINWDPNCTSAKEYMDLVRAQPGKVGMLLLYSIPSRDFSGGYSGGGAGTFEEYQAHVIKFCQAIGSTPCIVTYEPDSLPDMDALPSDKRAGRVAAMKWAIAYIKKTCANVWLYVDSGHSSWKDVATMVRLLKEVGASAANGSALNTSNTQSTSNQIVYGQAIAAGMGGNYRIIIDTGRNGNDAEPTNEWRNPTRRMYGRNPLFGGPSITGSPAIDGFLWNKTPGESDANYPSEAPNAGELYPNYIFRDGVADNSDTAGMAQRPPTIGVAYAGASGGQVGN